MIQERNQAHFRERKPMPKLKSQPKVIKDSDFQLNPVWPRVSAGSLPHHLVCVSHFSECHKMADDCMRNANKCPKILYSPLVREMEKWCEIRIRDWSPSNQLFRLAGPVITSSFKLSADQAQRQTEYLTDNLTWLHNLRLGWGTVGA